MQHFVVACYATLYLSGLDKKLIFLIDSAPKKAICVDDESCLKGRFKGFGAIDHRRRDLPAP